MAVCYMRPFTRGAWTLPSKYAPTSIHGKDLHRDLHDLRNQVYAQSDKTSGRRATVATQSEDGDVVRIGYQTAWLAFDPANLPAVQALCHDQRERFLTEAAAIDVKLEEPDASV
jgi:hypothetical protein